MSYLLAIFLPGLAVLFKKRFGMALLLLVLQLTVVGWLPAIVIAFSIIKKVNRQNRIEEAMKKALLQKSRFYGFWAKHPEKDTPSSPNED